MNRKSLLLVIIASSNLFVLALAFKVFLNNKSQQTFSYSIGQDSVDRQEIESKLKKECEKKIEDVIGGKRNMYICNLKKSVREEGSAYTIKTRTVVKRNENGHVSVETTGELNNRTRHSSEARFCEDCERKEDFNDPNLSLADVLSKVTDFAQEIQNEAKNSVSEVRRGFNQNESYKRISKTKERECLGTWIEKFDIFIEFEGKEEEINCKIDKLTNMNVLDKESYYNKTLKKELWTSILSEEDNDFLFMRLSEIISNPYEYTASVRSSANFMGHYIHWKNVFEQGEVSNINSFIEDIKRQAGILSMQIGSENNEIDLKQFNKGLSTNFIVQ